MSFRFVQLTDTHLYNKSVPDNQLSIRDEHFLKACEECAEQGADFLINTGDLLSGGNSRGRYERFKKLIDKVEQETGLHHYCVRGGHDASLPTEDYIDVLGRSNYWFEHKGWAFLVIDRFYKPYHRFATNTWWDLSPECLDEVDELLDEIPEDMPMVTLMHENPVGVSGFMSGDRLLEHLSRRNIKLFLFGHTHSNYVFTYRGIPHACVTGEGASFETAPLTYNVVTCNEDGTCSCDFKTFKLGLPEKPAVQVETGGIARLGEDWPDLRGPSGTRSANAELPAEAPKLVWKHQLPGPIGVGAPNIANGAVVYTTRTRGRFADCSMTAFDAVSGDVRWAVGLDGGAAGGALLRDGRAYCGTSAGSLYCVDAENGAVIWQWNNRENLPIACEPTLDDGLLHFGANWEAYAVEAATGKTAWRSLVCAVGGLSYFCPGHASPLVVGGRVYHHRIYNGDPLGPNSLIQSLDKDTGKDIEFGAYDVFPSMRQSCPILADGRIMTVCSRLLMFEPGNLQQAVLEIDAASGSTTPAYAEGIAYVSGAKYLMAFDTANGERLWEVPHETSLLHFVGSAMLSGKHATNNFSAPLIAGDKLLVCDTGGNARCLDAKTGNELWRVSTGAPILSAPTISGNTIFFGDYDGNAYAFAW